MPAGRPLKYKGEETIELAREYIDNCKDEIITDDNGRVVSYTVNLPKVAGLARKLGVRRETIHDWANKYPAFSNIVEECLTKQEENLINNGLSSTYNSNIVKLLLSKHGYRDSQDVTTGGEQINSVTFEIVNGSKNTNQPDSGNPSERTDEDSS